jgi:hypothetical protein
MEQAVADLSFVPQGPAKGLLFPGIPQDLREALTLNSPGLTVDLQDIEKTPVDRNEKAVPEQVAVNTLTHELYKAAVKIFHALFPLGYMIICGGTEGGFSVQAPFPSPDFYNNINPAQE